MTFDLESELWRTVIIVSFTVTEFDTTFSIGRGDLNIKVESIS